MVHSFKHLSVPFSQVTMILINNMSIARLILRVDTTLSGYPWALGLCSCNLKSGLHCLISPTRRRKREHPCGLMAYTPTVSTLILWAPLVLWAHFQRAEELDLEAWKNSPQWGRLVPSVTAPKLARRATNLPIHSKCPHKTSGQVREYIKELYFVSYMYVNYIWIARWFKKNYQLRVIFMSKDFLNYLATQSRQQLTTDERAVVTVDTKLQWPCHTRGRKSRGSIILMRSDLQLKHGFSNSHRAKVAHIVQLGGVHF